MLSARQITGASRRGFWSSAPILGQRIPNSWRTALIAARETSVSRPGILAAMGVHELKNTTESETVLGGFPAALSALFSLELHQEMHRKCGIQGQMPHTSMTIMYYGSWLDKMQSRHASNSWGLLPDNFPICVRDLLYQYYPSHSPMDSVTWGQMNQIQSACLYALEKHGVTIVQGKEPDAFIDDMPQNIAKTIYQFHRQAKIPEHYASLQPRIHTELYRLAENKLPRNVIFIGSAETAAALRAHFPFPDLEWVIGIVPQDTAQIGTQTIQFSDDIDTEVLQHATGFTLLRDSDESVKIEPAAGPSEVIFSTTHMPKPLTATLLVEPTVCLSDSLNPNGKGWHLAAANGYSLVHDTQQKGGNLFSNDANALALSFQRWLTSRLSLDALQTTQAYGAYGFLFSMQRLAMRRREEALRHGCIVTEQTQLSSQYFDERIYRWASGEFFRDGLFPTSGGGSLESLADDAFNHGLKISWFSSNEVSIGTFFTHISDSELERRKRINEIRKTPPSFFRLTEIDEKHFECLNTLVSGVPESRVTGYKYLKDLKLGDVVIRDSIRYTLTRKMRHSVRDDGSGLPPIHSTYYHCVPLDSLADAIGIWLYRKDAYSKLDNSKLVLSVEAHPKDKTLRLDKPSEKIIPPSVLRC